MSKFMSVGLIAGLGMFAMAPQAQAGQFDGTYALMHDTIGGEAEVCITMSGEETCVFADMDARLYGGDFTEESASDLAEESIAMFEETAERDLKPKVEEALYELTLMAYVELETEVNLRIDGLPIVMEAVQMPWDPTDFGVEMRNEAGESFATIGKIDPETGEYDLPGILGRASGRIFADQAHGGYGDIVQVIDVKGGTPALSVSINGRLFTQFSSHPFSPPTEQPPTTDDTDDTPPTTEGDDGSRILNGVPTLRPTR